MREDICSIPVNDVFMPKDGCPFCRMRDMLEDRMATYITGAAMMEPDVRVETNRLGFCTEHFNQILARGSRLSVALILESHLNEIRKEMKGGAADLFKSPGASATERIRSLEKDCYLCSRIDFSFGKVMENAVLLWEKEPAFRKKAENQPYFCLSHFEEYLRNAKGNLNKKDYALFYKQISAPTFRYFEELCGDVSWFCKKFDYRYEEEPWGNSKDSVERAIAFLSNPAVKSDKK